MPTGAPPGDEDDYSVRLIALDELNGLTPAWDDLAANSIEPNPFYESWNLLEAIKAFGDKASLIFVVVERTDQGQQKLCGLFPFQQRHSYCGVPVTTWSLWKHSFCSLCTPLLRQGHSAETLRALFSWMQSNPKAPSLFEWVTIHGEGPFRKALIQSIREQNLSIYWYDCFQRAMYVPADSFESYYEVACRTKVRQEHRRQRRRLEDLGKLEFRHWDSSQDIETWIHNLMDVEARGWKGRNQTAIQDDPASKQYFESMIRQAAANNRLVMLAMHLDDRPIAVKLNVLSGHGGFTLKIAYDEAYSKYSPGVQLELENMKDAQQRPELEWMDSCALPGHPMIDRLWMERRIIQKALISSGRRTGELALGLLPFYRALRSCIWGPLPVQKYEK